jgi:hypothetical protein
MALKTFTATRAADAPGKANTLRYWSLSAGGTALVVNFCDGTSATPVFQVQVPINSSASQALANPFIGFPNGLHVELVSGILNRGCIDI